MIRVSLMTTGVVMWLVSANTQMPPKEVFQFGSQPPLRWMSLPETTVVPLNGTGLKRVLTAMPAGAVSVSAMIDCAMRFESPP